MTKENNKLRLKIMKTEEIALNALHSQPEGDEDCNHHLLKALAKMAEVVGDYRGLIEVECTKIVWDTDGEKVDLPSTVRIMLDASENVGEVVANVLSDKFGWCVKKLDYRILP